MLTHRHSLYIIHNGHHEKTLSIQNIFDNTQYDQLAAITYSSSPRFIVKYCSKFEQFRLILGLPKKSLVKSIQNAVSNYYEAHDVKPFHDFKFQVAIRHRIHDKLYIMRNSNSGDTRIVTGSANLSFMAFNTHNSQDEEITVTDNDPIKYRQACQRYAELLIGTQDCDGFIHNIPFEHTYILNNAQFAKIKNNLKYGHYKRAYQQTIGQIPFTGLYNSRFNDLLWYCQGRACYGLAKQNPKYRFKMKLARNFFGLACCDKARGNWFYIHSYWYYKKAHRIWCKWSN